MHTSPPAEANAAATSTTSRPFGLAAASTCALNRAAWADTDVRCNARRSHVLRALSVRGDVCGG